MSTSIGQRLIDRGREEGLEQGLGQGIVFGKRAAVLRLLDTRFGSPSPSVQARVDSITDAERLDALLDAAVTAGCLEEFARSL